MQGAAFSYYGVSYLRNAEAGVTGYAGFGFGAKKNVLEAWSGEFRAASFDVSLPWLKLSAGATGFASPDRSLVGFDVHVGVALSATPTLGTVGVSDSVWKAWDEGTASIAWSTFGRPEYKTLRANVGGKSHAYIQHGGDGPIGQAQNMSFAMLHHAGWTNPLAWDAAAIAIAVGVAREHHWDRDVVCKKK